MKTATEWAEIMISQSASALRGELRIPREGNTTLLEHAILIIQLDAIKEGAKKAAEMAEQDWSSAGSRIKYNILAAAEIWTAKDLS